MFKNITPEELSGNAFSMIGKNWMLLTATKPDGSYNSMTASWGGVGILWNKPVLYCFIRPQRYTHEFSEAGDRMTASFFSEDHRAALVFCGRKSGRDYDKVKECALTPVRDAAGCVYYDEARTVLSLRKLYTGKIDPAGMNDPAIMNEYPQSDFHTVYVYEIEGILAKDES